ncbi:hypothetical protein [Pseudoruegeria sp. HB172150]|uniref:hypothetical protein n=1 Tax=Pseudoruegeria sp. HB172150 TaxID=2721164 RepID=UPI001554DD66|nr:hypothetical protein [Pseudoruegeria sp. HB172150]
MNKHSNDDFELIESEPQYMNDAELLGTDHPNMQEMLARPFVCMTGDLYGARDRRNTQDGDWKRVEMPLLAWLQGAEKGKRTWGLTRHPENKSKEGASIVLVDAIDGARTDSAIKTMYAVGLDIDSGASLDFVLDKLEDLGLFAIVYTSHSHGKDTLTLKHDDIMRKLKLKESPNRTQIQMYLREHHKDRYDDDFIETIEIEELRHQTKDGLKTILKTRPLDKFRVILPLWEPVELADLAPTVKEWKDVWADAVTGVAVNMLGVSFDSTCADVNRLFFTPRHAPDAEDWYSAVVQGRPLRFEDIEPYSKDKYVRNRGGDADPFAAVGGDHKAQREQFTTESSFDLNAWHRDYKERWLAADVIESFAHDKVRVAGGERPGTVHLECPFEHEHSKPDGTATMAMNPDENEAGYWTIFCRHDSCQGRNKLEFVRQMLEDGWFEESILTDEEWCIPLPDEDQEPEPKDVAATLDKKSKDSAIVSAAKGVAQFCEDEGFLERLIDDISARVSQRKTSVRRLVATGIKEAKTGSQMIAEGGSADGQNPQIILNNFRANSDDVRKVMTDQGDDPVLFHNMGRLVTVETDENANLRFQQTTPERLKARIEDRIDFYRENEKGDLKNVEAPKGIVNRIFQGDLTEYPPIHRIVSAPVCGAEGELVREAGYHKSGILFQPKPGVTIPEIPEEPTEDEVHDAVRKLAVPFREFPLDGMTADEFDAALENGDDVPSFCHLVSFGLTPICRDIIPGPTPIHLARKMKPRTGATTILMHMGYIATLDYVDPMALPDSKAEVVKTFVSMLDEGAPYGLLDNLSSAGEIESDEAASVVTAYPYYKARRLNHSAMIKASVKITWGATGNKTALSPQLAERTLLIQLDPKMEHPEDRKFSLNLSDHIPRHAGEYLYCLLVLVQNWKAKGCPKWEGQSLGGFKSHAEVIGGILEAAGIRGFMKNRGKLKAIAKTEEPTSALLDAAIAAHHAVPGGKAGVLFRAWGTQPPPKKIKNDAGEFIPYEYADHHVVAIRDLLNEHEIALKNLGWVKADSDGAIFYPEKAKQSVSQMVAGLTDDVREWDASKTDSENQHGRYQVQKVRDDQHGALYELVQLPPFE